MRARKPDPDQQPKNTEAKTGENTPKRSGSRSGKDAKVGASGILAIGLDNHDEQKRITQSEYFLVVGGSEETHERMQDTAIRFEEKLKDRGKRLQDTSIREAIDLLRDSMR